MSAVREDSVPFDLMIKGAQLVRPRADDTPVHDVAVRDGKVAAVGVDLPAEQAR